jgi:hypothetical protein
MIWLTILNASFVFNYRPFTDKLIQRLELLDDIIAVLLIDVCFMFTEIMDDKKSQYNIGFIFIILLSGCIIPQLYFLARDIFWQLKFRIRMFILKRKITKAPSFRSVGRRRRGFLQKAVGFFTKSTKEEKAED